MLFVRLTIYRNWSVTISQTTIEAEDNVDRLCILVEQTLKNNTELARRLDAFESGSLVTTTSYSSDATKEVVVPASGVEVDQSGLGNANYTPHVSEFSRQILQALRLRCL